MKKQILVIALLALVACKSKKGGETTSGPTQADADRGAQKFSGYTLADLNSGKSLYEGHCGNCHGLKNPASRNEEQWRHEVKVMAPKANRKAGSTVIGDKEQELIVRYLVTMGSAKK